MNTHGRDANKRRIKPVESAQQLLDFDLEESSDDSDFRIEDHAEESDDDSINSEEETGKVQEDDDESDSSDSDDDIPNNNKLMPNSKSVGDLLLQAKSRQSAGNMQFDAKALKLMICCGCLGDRSDDANEIVECDGCGVTVHEGCYGVSDTSSVSSTVSSCSTEPWFCEACKAGVTNPQCELCPNQGGIFKETDVGKWVHLVCALYVPGVAFSEVDHLSGVTLFEMPYNKWGAKICCLCEDDRFSRTGVCIGCDAGMCRTYFHVTCAQREGLLSEANSWEVDQADPFYAHCKLHSDKTLVRKRKRNYLAMEFRTQNKRLEQEQLGHGENSVQLRIQRKLKKHKHKYTMNKTQKIAPWVPTQKMPRLLTTSASACRKLMHKSQLMGIDVAALETQDAQVQALIDVRKKWNIPPAFSVEFIGYYLDRNVRVTSMKKGLEQLLDANTQLLKEQQAIRDKYNQAMKESSEQSRINITLKQNIHKLHTSVSVLCAGKTLPSVDTLGRAVPLAPRPLGVPTAAALKMGVGFPLNNIPAGRGDAGRVLSTSRQQESLLLNNECGICHQRNDQHLLAKCDTCHLFYHLGCLNPPLTRLPKKSKLYGWQCSECDKSSDSEPEVMEPKVPRRSRTRYSKDGTIISANSVPETSEVHPGKDTKGINDMKAKNEIRGSRNSRSESGSLKVTIKSCTGTGQSENHEVNQDSRYSTESLDQGFSQLQKEHSQMFLSSKSKSSKRARKQKHNTLLQDLSHFEPEEHSDTPNDQPKPNIFKHKHNFTSPKLTNTPLMSITPIVINSPVHSEDSGVNRYQNSSFLSKSSTFSSSLTSESDPLAIEPAALAQLSHRQNRKRRKEKHRSRYSPDLMRSPSKEHKRKRKKKTQDMENPNTTTSHPRITIKIKPIPLAPGQVVSTTNPQMFYVPSDSNDAPPRLTMRSPPITPRKFMISENSTMPAVNAGISNKSPNLITSLTGPAESAGSSRLSGQPQPRKGRESDIMTGCDKCQGPGTNQNLVRCDECMQCYHFACLDPPVKKNPKRRGYSWHCADCDPTETDSS